MPPEHYRDVLYAVKRNFLIIGLTGFTGSGCSSCRDILASTTKPELPARPADRQSQCATYCHPTTQCTSANQQSKRDERIFNKLQHTWARTEWKKFTKIQFSHVIFAISAFYAKNQTNTKGLIPQILNDIISEYSFNIDAAEHITSSEYDRRHKDTIVSLYESLDTVYNEFKNRVSTECRNSISFTRIMQNFGDNIRKYGTPFFNSAHTSSPSNLLIIPEATRRVLKSYYWTQKEAGSEPLHYVIDAFRNPFEVEYFKRRYNEFYLVGVLRNEEDRHRSLDIPADKFTSITKRERCELFKKEKSTITKWITSQNISECLEKSDVFIENTPGQTPTHEALRYNLIKLIALAKNPGCIPPTQDERNMQVAMTAKLMSGCISRQVGATVTNNDGYIIGVGWNDPPSGQTPCSLRTGKELANGGVGKAFSSYERSEQFVQHISANRNDDHPFCFRHELSVLENRAKRNEFTRALHAEENAFFQAINTAGHSIINGSLYTTSRTCTLCAKKAYQLGISKIIYIEEYTDIAISQTIETGTREITIQRFQGITGAAYFKLFSPLIQEKDYVQLFLAGS